MVKEIYERTKPNLLVYQYENSPDRLILFSLSGPEKVIEVSRSIDEVVNNNIGNLMVKDTNVEIIKGNKPTSLPDHSFDLGEYLSLIKKKFKKNDPVVWQSNPYAQKYFGLSYLIDASTTSYKIDENVQIYQLRQNLIKLIDEALSSHEKRDIILKELERITKKPSLFIGDNILGLKELSEKTLRGVQEILKNENKKYSSLPRAFADLGVIGSTEKRDINQDYVFYIVLKSLEKNSGINPKVLLAEKSLIKSLDSLEGPNLSYDAKSLVLEEWWLYNQSIDLISRSGNVLTNPNWRKRLFILDP